VLRAREHPTAAPEPLQLAPIAALLPALFRRAKGNAVRIQEILKAEHAIDCHRRSESVVVRAS
jgi:hypothetical protein